MPCTRTACKAHCRKSPVLLQGEVIFLFIKKKRGHLDHDGFLWVVNPDIRPHFRRVLDHPVAGGHARAAFSCIRPEGAQLVRDVRKLRLGEPAAHPGSRRTSEHTAMLAKPGLAL